MFSRHEFPTKVSEDSVRNDLASSRVSIFQLEAKTEPNFIKCCKGQFPAGVTPAASKQNK